MTEYDLHREHPDVTLAKAHRAQRRKYEAMREREPDPEPDLREQVRELADRLTIVCAALVVDGIRSGMFGVHLTSLRESCRAFEAIERRLR